MSTDAGAGCPASGLIVLVIQGLRCWAIAGRPWRRAGQGIGSGCSGCPARTLEDVDPLAVAAGDLAHGVVTCDLAGTEVDAGVPEGGAADRETDEARHAGGDGQPVATFLSSSPRPRMMQPTLSRPPRRAAATTFLQSSALSSPSIFQTSPSTPASCNWWIAWTIRRRTFVS